MPYVPPTPRVPADDPDVCPATPFGPGKEWRETIELMIGVGDIKQLDLPDEIYLEHDEMIHLHPGPLGFVPVDTRPRSARRAKKARQSNPTRRQK